jgi:uncharacterized membrane protein
MANEKNNGNGKSPSESERTLQQQAEKNIRKIMRLEKRAFQNRSTMTRIADTVTGYAGSPPFVALHVFWFCIWIVVNVNLVPAIEAFDPYPFSFLTMVVSLEAIFLSLLVLMTQNRITRESDKRSHLDLQINLLAEQQGTMILGMLQKLCEHHGLEHESEDALREMIEETDIHQLVKTLEEKLPA